MPELIRLLNTILALIGILALFGIVLGGRVARPYYLFYMAGVATFFGLVISIEYRAAGRGYSLAQFLILASLALLYAGAIVGHFYNRKTPVTG